MGTGSSVSRSEDLDVMLEVEHYIPPSFHMEPKILPHHARMCQESWERIKVGNTVAFTNHTSELESNVESKDELGFNTPEIYFIADFYRFLFDRLPSTKPLFTNIDKQYVMLAKVIEIIISTCNEEQVSTQMLVDLTERHNKLKIHPAFYGEFCYSFLVTIKKHMDTEWTSELNHAWCTMFSVVLRIMVPVAVKGFREWSDGASTSAQALSLCAVGDAPPQSLGV
eukprot:CAMPEP_0113937088 /NCGR_PEP_ID=MMETSP1339-20121228/3790_1 /TAXON_ID=94617 /ORGANISM="Fibrocapsa japonica" /LENGTH=224 /DNA_ID=CAMNT_0000939729 /DNA_START=79 /DNA_END=753 /DNA_ORIENTATION=+ /assembly_acc=CAM_ASM_000762